MAEDKEFIGYYMTSVKENINVEEPIHYLIDNIVERLDKFSSNENLNFIGIQGRDTHKLHKNSQKDKNNKKEGCC